MGTDQIDKNTELLRQAERYCAYQERCQQEVRDKLYSWGGHKNVVENIIAELISHEFINEERYARAFARGKFRIKHWGKIKIRIELRKKKISDYCIKKGLQEISDDDYYEALQSLITDKRKRSKARYSIKEKYKLAQYAISKGYESELIWEIINKMEK